LPRKIRTGKVTPVLLMFNPCPEAKRVVVNLEHFREIELDFKGVATVGQAFGDEIFRVWHNAHPEIRLVPIHANDNIKFMIRRAGGEV